MKKLVEQFNQWEKENGNLDQLILKGESIILKTPFNTIEFDPGHYWLFLKFYLLTGSNPYAEDLKDELQRKEGIDR